uniref:Potassium channel domain-containing protein n=1 Tax=Caenorhabditis japonica TaxID=281687 RepID=A0A8R1I3J4_CAEJA
MYFNFANTSEFSETKLRRVLSEYDTAMGITIDSRMDTRWDLWAGLYYAGTIYTTIGYGDLAAVTVWGRICTMMYAMIGIPIVINILNDWGNMLFYFVDPWRRCDILLFIAAEQSARELQSGSMDTKPLMDSQSSANEISDPSTRPIPLLLVVVVLLFWMAQCVAYFAYFENWTLFESIYFFFISMTTIGFGDFTPSHTVAVGGIVFILGGLSVVSMCINVIQMQLEYLFNQIVQRIENDFKTTLSVAAEEGRKKSIGVSEFGSIEPSKKKTMQSEGDVAQKYSEGMEMGSKLLMRLMSNHQRRMLNEKFDERARMRNSGTQTTSQIKVASVQTADRYEQTWDDEPEEDNQPKSRINTRRLYIYNTGE